MIDESIKDVKHIFGSFLDMLSGGDKRRAAAEIAKEYGPGGQVWVAKEFKIGRDTIRKGTNEIETGEKIQDKFSQRGRDSTQEKMPQLESQLHEILSSQSQIDPKFQTERLYTKMTVNETRNQLIKRYGYSDEELPSDRTLNTIINNLNYGLKSVMKTKPIKKIEETELIFYNLDRIHNISEEDENIVRLSIDTKDRVKIGEFSRGGKSRVAVEAYDHDFGDKYAVPFGIYNVKEKTVEIFISETKVTADFMMDCIEQYWECHGYSNSGKKLLLNVDNGSENNSQRTQFMKRMAEFSVKHNTEVILAYYPPYHSKYNPVERVWGALEQHWNGDLLDTTETVVKFAESMTFAKKHPIVTVIDKVYATGVKVSKKVMQVYEKAMDRMAGLEKWFIRINPNKCRKMLSDFGVVIV